MTILWFDNLDKESKSIVHKVDDNFKVITNVKGIQSDGGTIVDVSKLKNATSQPKISIANVNYEVFGTGNVKLTLGEKELVISGRGNYGLKPTETKLVDEEEQSVQLLADATVPKFNISLECHKETGFEE
tara:strand:+ start:1273 stop:1662 length:390 start_codon:yes stop_codon:yes gene_type:complete